MNQWEVVPRTDTKDAVKIIERDQKYSHLIREIAQVNTPDGDPKCHQYARLMASAPQLLEHLKWALEALEVSGLETWPDSNGWDSSAYKEGLKQIRESIASAEGSSEA